jgi:NIMA (never in mitosis gene a)-related kinase
MDRPSSVPSKYEKLKVLGEGAFGKAFLVRDRETGLHYCLKRTPLGDNPEKVRQESQLLARLDHPNIIRHVESFERSGYLYIAMDFADGGDVEAVLNKHRAESTRMDEKTVMNVFSQVLLGLDYLHSHRILHRDIKPMNVLLMKDGSVKLADFGIARVLAAGSMAHTWIGTPTYLAPEVWNGETYGWKADVWSLGCLLYELCMKRAPFEGQCVAAICTKVLRGRFAPISGPYSPDIGRLVARMLVRSPRDRPSAAELLKASIVKQVLGTGSGKSTRGTGRPQMDGDPRQTVRRRGVLDGDDVSERRVRCASPPPVGLKALDARRAPKNTMASDDDEKPIMRRRSPGPVNEVRRQASFRPPPELLRSIISTRNQPVYNGLDEAEDGFDD